MDAAFDFWEGVFSEDGGETSVVAPKTDVSDTNTKDKDSSKKDVVSDTTGEDKKKDRKKPSSTGGGNQDNDDDDEDDDDIAPVETVTYKFVPSMLLSSVSTLVVYQKIIRGLYETIGDKSKGSKYRLGKPLSVVDLSKYITRQNINKTMTSEDNDFLKNGAIPQSTMVSVLDGIITGALYLDQETSTFGVASVSGEASLTNEMKGRKCCMIIDCAGVAYCLVYAEDAVYAVYSNGVFDLARNVLSFVQTRFKGVPHRQGGSEIPTSATSVGNNHTLQIMGGVSPDWSVDITFDMLMKLGFKERNASVSGIKEMPLAKRSSNASDQSSSSSPSSSTVGAAEKKAGRVRKKQSKGTEKEDRFETVPGTGKDLFQKIGWCLSLSSLVQKGVWEHAMIESVVDAYENSDNTALDESTQVIDLAMEVSKKAWIASDSIDTVNMDVDSGSDASTSTSPSSSVTSNASTSSSSSSSSSDVAKKTPYSKTYSSEEVTLEAKAQSVSGFPDFIRNDPEAFYIIVAKTPQRPSHCEVYAEFCVPDGKGSNYKQVRVRAGPGYSWSVMKRGKGEPNGWRNYSKDTVNPPGNRNVTMMKVAWARKCRNFASVVASLMGTIKSNKNLLRLMTVVEERSSDLSNEILKEIDLEERLYSTLVDAMSSYSSFVSVNAVDERMFKGIISEMIVQFYFTRHTRNVDLHASMAPGVLEEKLRDLSLGSNSNNLNDVASLYNKISVVPTLKYRSLKTKKKANTNTDSSTDLVGQVITRDLVVSNGSTSMMEIIDRVSAMIRAVYQPISGQGVSFASEHETTYWFGGSMKESLDPFFVNALCDVRASSSKQKRYTTTDLIRFSVALSRQNKALGGDPTTRSLVLKTEVPSKLYMMESVKIGDKENATSTGNLLFYNAYNTQWDVDLLSDVKDVINTTSIYYDPVSRTDLYHREKTSTQETIYEGEVSVRVDSAPSPMWTDPVTNGICVFVVPDETKITKLRHNFVAAQENIAAPTAVAAQAPSTSGSVSSTSSSSTSSSSSSSSSTSSSGSSTVTVDVPNEPSKKRPAPAPAPKKAGPKRSALKKPSAVTVFIPTDEPPKGSRIETHCGYSSRSHRGGSHRHVRFIGAGEKRGKDPASDQDEPANKQARIDSSEQQYLELDADSSWMFDEPSEESDNPVDGTNASRRSQASVSSISYISPASVATSTRGNSKVSYNDSVRRVDTVIIPSSLTSSSSSKATTKQPSKSTRNEETIVIEEEESEEEAERRSLQELLRQEDEKDREEEEERQKRRRVIVNDSDEEDEDENRDDKLVVIEDDEEPGTIGNVEEDESWIERLASDRLRQFVSGVERSGDGDSEEEGHYTNLRNAWLYIEEALMKEYEEWRQARTDAIVNRAVAIKKKDQNKIDARERNFMTWLKSLYPSMYSDSTALEFQRSLQEILNKYLDESVDRKYLIMREEAMKTLERFEERYGDNFDRRFPLHPSFVDTHLIDVVNLNTSEIDDSTLSIIRSEVPGGYNELADYYSHLDKVSEFMEETEKELKAAMNTRKTASKELKDALLQYVKMLRGKGQAPFDGSGLEVTDWRLFSDLPNGSLKDAINAQWEAEARELVLDKLIEVYDMQIKIMEVVRTAYKKAFPGEDIVELSGNITPVITFSGGPGTSSIRTPSASMVSRRGSSVASSKRPRASTTKASKLGELKLKLNKLTEGLHSIDNIKETVLKNMRTLLEEAQSNSKTIDVTEAKIRLDEIVNAANDMVIKLENERSEANLKDSDMKVSMTKYKKELDEYIKNTRSLVEGQADAILQKYLDKASKDTEKKLNALAREYEAKKREVNSTLAKAKKALIDEKKRLEGEKTQLKKDITKLKKEASTLDKEVKNLETKKENKYEKAPSYGTPAIEVRSKFKLAKARVVGLYNEVIANLSSLNERGTVKANLRVLLADLVKSDLNTVNQFQDEVGENFDFFVLRYKCEVYRHITSILLGIGSHTSLLFAMPAQAMENGYFLSPHFDSTEWGLDEPMGRHALDLITLLYYRPSVNRSTRHNDKVSYAMNRRSRLFYDVTWKNVLYGTTKPTAVEKEEYAQDLDSWYRGVLESLDLHAAVVSRELVKNASSLRSGDDVVWGGAVDLGSAMYRYAFSSIVYSLYESINNEVALAKHGPKAAKMRATLSSTSDSNYFTNELQSDYWLYLTALDSSIRSSSTTSSSSSSTRSSTSSNRSTTGSSLRQGSLRPNPVIINVEDDVSSTTLPFTQIPSTKSGMPPPMIFNFQ